MLSALKPVGGFRWHFASAAALIRLGFSDRVGSLAQVVSPTPKKSLEVMMIPLQSSTSLEDAQKHFPAIVAIPCAAAKNCNFRLASRAGSLDSLPD